MPTPPAVNTFVRWSETDITHAHALGVLIAPEDIAKLQQLMVCNCYDIYGVAAFMSDYCTFCDRHRRYTVTEYGHSETGYWRGSNEGSS